MGRIKKNIPNFVSGIEPQEIEFNNLTELMAIPWVKQWADDENFFRFSVSDGCYLLAEVDAGKKWWVIGYLSDVLDYQLDLPRHEPVE